MRIATLSTLFATTLCIAGCTAADDDADRFREAVPTAEQVALKLPGRAAGGTGVSTLGLRPADNGVGTTSDARYYNFTRALTSAVDRGTATVLGAIVLVTDSPPTTLEPKRAVWGPGQATALEPAVYRFVVTEVEDGAYDFVFEGRPKAGGEFVTLLHGHGYGKTHPEHGKGWFLADNEARRALDPSKTDDRGTVKVTYDLASAPKTIAAEVRQGEALGSSDVTVTHEAAGAGRLTVTARGDVNGTSTPEHEDVSLRSRWDATGAGRADAEMKNGDLPVTVNAAECWSSSFTRVFYEDTVSYEPKMGDAAKCAFAEP